jgi:hypothetical protein
VVQGWCFKNLKCSEGTREEGTAFQDRTSASAASGKRQDCTCTWSVRQGFTFSNIFHTPTYHDTSTCIYIYVAEAGVTPYTMMNTSTFSNTADYGVPPSFSHLHAT